MTCAAAWVAHLPSTLFMETNHAVGVKVSKWLRSQSAKLVLWVRVPPLTLKLQQMIDNFLQLEAMLNITPEMDGDLYFHLQVIQRKKDCDINKNSHLIRAYQVDSTHLLSRYKDEVIDLCEKFKARAYLNPSAKSKRATAIQMLNNIADCFRQSNFQYLNRLWNSAAGQVGAVNKVWILDCDYSEQLNDDTIQELSWIIDRKCRPDGDKVIAFVPTKHGKHILTRPFNVMELRERFTLPLDIHKNNPTVLYIPKSIE